MFHIACHHGQVVTQGGGGDQVVGSFVAGLDAQATPEFRNQRCHGQDAVRKLLLQHTQPLFQNPCKHRVLAALTFYASFYLT